MGLELRYCTSVVLRPQLSRELGSLLLVLGNDGECFAREASCALMLLVFGNRNVPASESVYDCVGITCIDSRVSVAVARHPALGSTWNCK